jgi:hypothetical protein
MPIKFKDLDPKMKRILTTYPVRNLVNWKLEAERVILEYPKDFSNFESWLQKRIGGPANIRRPLDEVGTKIWLMCDGKHSVNDICAELDEVYREEIEPVLDRVSKFLELLLRANLIRLSPKQVYPKKKRVVKQ